MDWRGYWRTEEGEMKWFVGAGLEGGSLGL